MAVEGSRSTSGIAICTENFFLIVKEAIAINKKMLYNDSHHNKSC